MTRLLLALALAIGAAGCATDVEDPLTEPLPAEPQRNPPRQPYAGELYDPLSDVVVDLDHYRPDRELPPLQIPGDVWPYVER